MTQPPAGWPNGQPQDPNPAGWQQPPSEPGTPAGPPAAGGQYGPPAGGQYGPPAAWGPPPAAGGQPAWGAPQQPTAGGQYGPPAGPWEQSGPWEPLGPQGQPSRAKMGGRGRLLASAAVVVALAAGGVTTYVAMSDTNSSGASSPREAVQSIVGDLNKSDLIGVLDDLAPGERAALANPALDTIKQLKRVKVLQPDADPKSVSGVTFKAQGLTFTGKTVTINDHVQVVELTGGTLQVGSDASKVPFTRDFLDSAFPGGLPRQNKGPQQINIADKVHANNNKPIRIATQKVGGRWYPSIFYTAADAASNGQAPAKSDFIPAAGGSSPKDAVTRIVNALLQDDLTGAIKLLSPDELAVMHDYGGKILHSASDYSQPGFTIKDLQVTTENESGGATRVMLKSITVASDNGDQTSVAVDGSCFTVTSNGKEQKECTSNLVDGIVSFLDDFGASTKMAPAQRQAFEHLLSGLTKVGVDTTQSGGQWYVNPVRSYLDISSSILSGLQGNDLLELIGFFRQLGDH